MSRRRFDGFTPSGVQFLEDWDDEPDEPSQKTPGFVRSPATGIFVSAEARWLGGGVERKQQGGP